MQSLIRGHIARKKFRIIFSQKEQNNFSLFKEKLTKMHNKTFKSQNKSNFSSPSKFNLSQINRTLSNVENNDLRELKIINKPPPKNLLLKHRKLLEATKQNNIFMARNSGFAYYPNDMNVKDKNENTPLYYSTKHSNIEFCQYLIEFGARVNERCEGGNTPFHLAFQINSIDVLYYITL